MTASFFDPAALRTRLREQPSLDVPFLVVLLALLSYGLIMLFSAGYAVALYRRGDAYTYIRPQLLFAALGAAAMYAASLVDYHVWHKLAWPVDGAVADFARRLCCLCRSTTAANGGSYCRA